MIVSNKKRSPNPRVVTDQAQLPKTSSFQVPDGLAGSYATLDFMREKAHIAKKDPRVRSVALRIVGNLPSQNYRDEARAIAEFVHKNVRYVRDIKNVETLHDPVTMLEQVSRGVAQGDCDDMSLLIASLLLSIGHKPYFRIVRYRANGPWSHIYVVAYEKNHGEMKPTRIVMDAILKRQPIGYEAPHHSGEEHLV